MKILAIDDQPEDLKHIIKALEEARDIEGPDTGACQLVVLGDFDKALRLLERERFDAVITDMIGPTDHNRGNEIMRQMCGKTPITIVLTAHPSSHNCVESMRAGAWDYLEKDTEDGSDPYENLIKSLREACRAKKENPEDGRYNPDSAWITRNIDILMKEYPGKLVAVLDQTIVDQDTDYNQLVTRLEQRYPLAHPVIFDTPDPVAMERKI
ncbi:MAG: response regulator [Candidatus Sumerlaeota bacterium]|nr:response regulator [Candidatus Sumerlaeota bacterium]